MSTVTKYPCPQCKALTSFTDNPYKPFCSERCQLIDLGAWANEDYKVADKRFGIPDTEQSDEDDDLDVYL